MPSFFQITLQAQRISDLSLEVSAPAIADLNQDGFNEIIFVSCGVGCGSLIGTNGGGSPVLTPPVDGPGMDHAEQPAFLRAQAERASQSSQNFLAVHVLDGASGYQQELGSFPRFIDGVGGISPTPTVTVADINFDGDLDVLVGGLIYDFTTFLDRSVFAFRADGSDVPGWEFVSSAFPPFWNSFAVADANLDGALDVIACDQSTFLHRYSGLGELRQCQYVDEDILSSPAVGDFVNQQGLMVSDGIPDMVSAGTLCSYLRAYDGFGSHRECFFLSCSAPASDLIWTHQPQPRKSYLSSPALADLDADGTQDLVIHRQVSLSQPSQLEVFSSRFGLLRHNLPALPDPLPASRDILGVAYSSPAILDLDGDGVLQEIVVGSCSGHLSAFRLNLQNSVLELLWQTELDPGEAHSAIACSPVAANLVGDSQPEIVIGNEAGHFFIVDPMGSVLRRYRLQSSSGGNWQLDDAIWSTPVIGVPAAGDRPMIVVGNRTGVYRARLDDYPVFDDTQAQWPTFHQDNARTGSHPFPTLAQKGSVGGNLRCPQQDQLVELLTISGQAVNDHQTGLPAAMQTTADGRFLFEMVEPGSYLLRFYGIPGRTQQIQVQLGVLTTVQGPCRCRVDWNGDGILTVQDLFDFLNGYFLGDADFNGDAGTSVQDIFDYINGYFAGCD